MSQLAATVVVLLATGQDPCLKGYCVGYMH